MRETRLGESDGTGSGAHAHTGLNTHSLVVWQSPHKIFTAHSHKYLKIPEDLQRFPEDSQEIPEGFPSLKVGRSKGGFTRTLPQGAGGTPHGSQLTCGSGLALHLGHAHHVAKRILLAGGGPVVTELAHVGRGGDLHGEGGEGGGGSRGSLRGIYPALAFECRQGWRSMAYWALQRQLTG